MWGQDFFNTSLNLKDLTIETLALTALSSSDRGQSLHLLNIENMYITSNGFPLCFVIFSPLKHTRRVVKPNVVECPNTDVPALNVSDYVTAHLNRTISLRASIVRHKPKPTQFIFSWATKKPVSKPTLSRWLKWVLISGIDATHFLGTLLEVLASCMHIKWSIY